MGLKPLSRFALATRLLRRAGHLDIQLPAQRKGESPIDWMVRFGLAPSPERAAEALIVAIDRMKLLDETCELGIDDEDIS